MRKTIWITALSSACAVCVAGNALAEEPAPAGGAAPAAAAPAPKKSHKAKYGAAGCGLGSMIISSGGIVQIFAATTNATSYSQTFGITSGTSNCDDTDADDGARNYVHANRVALAKDISRGSGETLDGLAAIAGCADAKAVGASLQHNFKVIFPSASVSSDQVTDSIMTTLKSDTSLACGAVGG